MKTFTVKILDAIESLARYCTTDDEVEDFEQQYRETEELKHVCANAQILLKIWPELTRIFRDREVEVSVDEYGSPVIANVRNTRPAYRIKVQIEMGDGYDLSYYGFSVGGGSLNVEERYPRLSDCHNLLEHIETGAHWINESLERLIAECGTSFEYNGQHKVSVCITEER